MPEELSSANLKFGAKSLKKKKESQENSPPAKSSALGKVASIWKNGYFGLFFDCFWPFLQMEAILPRAELFAGGEFSCDSFFFFKIFCKSSKLQICRTYLFRHLDFWEPVSLIKFDILGTETPKKTSSYLGIGVELAKMTPQGFSSPHSGLSI